MAHANVAIFIPHRGCPHACSFCNQHSISGAQSCPTAGEVNAVCANALNTMGNAARDAEIAFFGGSFTAIDKTYMLELLQAACQFVGNGKFHGIRISTRPDCIDADILCLLRQYGVTAIELGVQSMDDTVLSMNDRGHTSADVIEACALIKAAGFELGLQMMVGLYGDSEQAILHTANQIVRLAPTTARVYPVVVLQGTRLAELYERGEYAPMNFAAATELCATLLLLFAQHDISVIRMGLHASKLVQAQMVSGIYHPAFREICQGIIYKRLIEAEMTRIGGDSFTVYVDKQSVSQAVGQKRCNLLAFEQMGKHVRIIGVDGLAAYTIQVTT